VAELFTLEETEGILEDLGGVPVSYGGVETHGTFGHVTSEFEGVNAGEPFVTIERRALPGIGLDDSTGELAGVQASILVGDSQWTVRAIGDTVPADRDLIRVYLSNRRPI
jgi:hypothetical protein